MIAPLVLVGGVYVPFDTIRQVRLNKDRTKVQYELFDPTHENNYSLTEDPPPGVSASEYRAQRVMHINRSLKES